MYPGAGRRTPEARPRETCRWCSAARAATRGSRSPRESRRRTGSTATPARRRTRATGARRTSGSRSRRRGRTGCDRVAEQPRKASLPNDPTLMGAAMPGRGADRQAPPWSTFRRAALAWRCRAGYARPPAALCGFQVDRATRRANVCPGKAACPSSCEASALTPRRLELRAADAGLVRPSSLMRVRLVKVTARWVLRVPHPLERCAPREERGKRSACRQL
jgi:hypothetical protein